MFSTLGLAVFTALLFVATLILASYTDDLRRYAEEQASDMKSAIKEAARSADAAVKSAEAAERSSISSRAYIFVSYLAPKGDGPQIVPSPDAKTFSVKIRFSLKNLGQTPALITDLDTHFLIDKERQMINPAPEPGSAKFQDMIESFRQPPTPIGDATESTSDQSYPIFDVGGHAPTPFPAQASMTFDQLFFFRRPVPQLKNVHGSWFFCVVTYRDVFTGRDRHTHYYGKIVGSSFALATQPEYNRWD